MVQFSQNTPKISLSNKGSQMGIYKSLLWTGFMKTVSAYMFNVDHSSQTLWYVTRHEWRETYKKYSFYFIQQ